MLLLQTMTTSTFTYSKTEKLKSRKQIQALFAGGKHVKTEKLRLIFLPLQIEDAPLKIGVSVSKKHFKLAVDRNRIKRLMREVYRLNQHDLKAVLSQPYVLMLIYQSNKTTTFDQLDNEMKKIIDLFSLKSTPKRV